MIWPPCLAGWPPVQPGAGPTEERCFFDLRTWIFLLKMLQIGSFGHSTEESRVSRTTCLVCGVWGGVGFVWEVFWQPDHDPPAVLSLPVSLSAEKWSTFWGSGADGALRPSQRRGGLQTCSRGCTLCYRKIFGYLSEENHSSECNSYWKLFGFLEKIKTSQDQPCFQLDERGVNPAAHKEFKMINIWATAWKIGRTLK